MEGYIYLWRGLTEKAWWQKQRFTWGQAWIDMIFMANFKEGEAHFDSGIYKIPRGSFITSQRKLAERWGWGISRVNFFLSYLQKTERCIELKTEHNFTHIIIINYERNQNPKKKTEHKTEHKAEQERNTSGTPAETIEYKGIKDKESNILVIWNSYPTKGELPTGRVIKNILVEKRLLPPCRGITPEIEKAFEKLTAYKEEDFKKAIQNYITDIINRNPSNDYANHRFSFYEFIKQENGFRRFLNK